MSKYGLNKTWQGYEIVRFGDRKRPAGSLTIGDMYLVSIRNSKCKWHGDFLFSKKYSLRTAKKHLEELKKGEIK